MGWVAEPARENADARTLAEVKLTELERKLLEALQIHTLAQSDEMRLLLLQRQLMMIANRKREKKNG